MLNNSGTRYKRSRLEKDINKDVLGCVVILIILCLTGAIGKDMSNMYFWTYFTVLLKIFFYFVLFDPKGFNTIFKKILVKHLNFTFWNICF